MRRRCRAGSGGAGREVIKLRKIFPGRVKAEGREFMTFCGIAVPEKGTHVGRRFHPRGPGIITGGNIPKCYLVIYA